MMVFVVTVRLPDKDHVLGVAASEHDAKEVIARSHNNGYSLDWDGYAASTSTKAYSIREFNVLGHVKNDIHAGAVYSNPAYNPRSI